VSHLITQFFSIDHERLDFLFRMYKKNKVHSRYKASLLFEKFSDGLKQHIEWEEQLLFPTYDTYLKDAESSPVKQMLEEHKQILQKLDTIRSRLCNAQNSDALEAELTELLLMHNEKEEQVLYGRCDDSISENKLCEIFLEL